MDFAVSTAMKCFSWLSSSTVLREHLSDRKLPTGADGFGNCSWTARGRPRHHAEVHAKMEKKSSQPLKRRRRVDDREESQRSRGKRRGMMFRKDEDDQSSQIKPMFLARYFPKFDSHPNFFSYNLVFKSPAIHSISYPRTNAPYNI